VLGLIHELTYVNIEWYNVNSITLGLKMKFEWDINKNKLNTEKHGITFEEASEVFNDNNALTQFNRLVGNEERMHIIGKMLDVVVALVVYTERNGNTRIISARKANKIERGMYYDNQK